MGSPAFRKKKKGVFPPLPQLFAERPTGESILLYYEARIIVVHKV
jgi:hypothetical protein